MSAHEQYQRSMDKERARREAFNELRNLLTGIEYGHTHIILLDDYHVANLKALLRAMGYATLVDPNPLQVANNGDWVGELFMKLPEIEHKPNASFDELAAKARAWKEPSTP